LIITHAQIDELFDGTEKALDDTVRWLNTAGRGV